MSNLSAEKGLRDVFQTFDRLRQRGVATELVLAGPAATPGDAELVDQLVTAAGDGVHYLGPVYGTDRDKFFDAVDIFLFPSRYRHESFGLVAGEALVRGVEIVAYARGCLTSELVAEAGLLLPRTGPFAEPAAAWIADHGRQSKQSFATIRDKRAEAEAKAQAVASEMVLRHHEDMTGFLASSRASWRRVLVDSRMQFDACRRR
jgi:glycosyltransferase involved in cell wall biosynthesis